MENRNDIPGTPGKTGAASPSSGGRGGPHPTALKRKLTLLQLIDELSALKEDDHGLHAIEEKREKDHFIEVDTGENVSKEEREGAEMFRKFDKSISSLDQGLLSFQTAARQLGSSVGLLASAHQLRTRLHTIQALFHENAADIFPTQIKSKAIDIEPLKPKTKRNKNNPRARSNSRALLLRRSTVTVAPELDTLPAELFALSRDVKAFLTHLEEFPEFVDEALNESITAFEMDLQYRADCLSEYQDQFRWKAVQKYVHGVSMEMTLHLDIITRALQEFVANGVPAIRFAQKHNGDNLLNLSTIATFFSGVTATAAQYSFDKREKPLDRVTNLMFFGSLVLSISAAINSLLGLTWKRAMYRSPRHRVPWWVLIWIKRSPLVLMVISVGLFSTGLVCFCYATQPFLVSIFVLVLTCFCTMGLLAVSAWFTAERWIYSKHNGLRWLSDVLSDQWESFIRYPPVRFIRYIPRRILAAFRRLFAPCLPNQDESIIEDGLPYANGGDNRASASPSPINYRPSALDLSEKGMSPLDSPVVSSPRLDRASEDDVGISSPVRSPARIFSLSSALSDSTTRIDTSATSTAPPAPPPPALSKLRQIAWKVADNQKETSSIGSNPTARSMTILADQAKRRETGDGKSNEVVRQPTRIGTIRPALKKLQVTHTIFDHTGLVRHVQFSPNGKMLATSGWDGTARLYIVPTDPNSAVERGKVMAVSEGFINQVAWSPDGNWLLTKKSHAIQVWSTETAVRKHNIRRASSVVKSVCWFPSSNSFLSVEESQVVQFGLDGELQETYELDRLNLWDVGITPDEERMLGVAELTKTKSGLQPRMSKIEKRVVVYNLKEKKVESLVPVLDEVRDITISRSGQYALVSSENKGPPQLLRMDIVNGVGRLVPAQTYLPKHDVDFAGPSYFAGVDDELIMVPTKSGDILLWDRQSGQLLHALRNKDVGENDLTSVAWNYALRRPMLASGEHDGSVRIWMSASSEREMSREKGRTSEPIAPIMYPDILTTSPPSTSRQQTSTTDQVAHNIIEVRRRSSMDGSVDGDRGGGRARRVDSPVPSHFSTDR